MLYIKLLLIFISVHEFAACPAGSIQGNHPTDCYHVYFKPKNWVAANEYCQDGHLTSISDVLQNAFLQKVIQSLLLNADGVWIGGNTLVTPGNWTWSDKTPFNYTNWQKGQPTGNQGLCASINRVDGSWSSQSCSQNFPYICKINGTSDSLISTHPTCAPCPSCSPSTIPIFKPCPDGYLYNQETKFCYKLYNINASFNDSEAICNNDGGHLASIHSYAEYSFIQTQFGVFCFPWRNVANVSPWTGLQFQNEQLTWTDGTPTDYLNLKPKNRFGFPICMGIGLDQSDFLLSGYVSRPCILVYNFICKRSVL